MCIYLQILPKFLQVVYEKYAFALAGLAGFDDHYRVDSVLSLLLGHVAFEFLHLMWDDPCLWIEPKVDWVLVFHLLQALRQVTLLSNLVH